MAKKGENPKKVAGNARKAEAAAAKQVEKDKQAADAEAREWSKGAKDNRKADAAAAKAAEAARKKAEKAALAAEEEAALPAKPKGNAKSAQKKSRGIDSAFSSFDGSSAAASLNATGIDNALDALSLTSGKQEQIDRHPERRFPAAYKAFEERRLEEMKDEKGLRRQQKIDQIRKEFEKHPDNPFNQVAGQYNSTREELQAIKQAEKDKAEARLAGTS